MINCPACGKENEDSAFECKRCRAPLREDAPESESAREQEASSQALGMVCRRCEAYNEPGVRVCTNCGYQLFADALAGAAPPLDKTPPQPFAHDSAAQEPALDTTPLGGTFTEELSALALSDEEAAEAGMSNAGNGAQVEPPLDRTPSEPFSAPVHEEPPAQAHSAPPPRGRVAEVASAAAGGAVGAAAGIAASRRPAVAEPAPPPKAPEPVAAPAEKSCSNCGAANPPAAKFCSDCGTPFAKKAQPPEPKAPEPIRAAPPPLRPLPPAPRIDSPRAKGEPPPSIQVSPTIQIDPELTESTVESEAVSAEEPLPEELPAEDAFAAEALPEEIPAEEPLPEPAEEALPFQATLVVEKGAAQGTAFTLAHLENSIGTSGAHVGLGEDPFIAPRAATLLFAEDHLILRDEGSANGVFVKVRESAALERGDLFVAGERLLRYDGATDLQKEGESDTPFLGAPRPQAAAVRITEVLGGGKTGRTCHRSGPVIAIGRTGCDMNFPADGLLAARHAEIRLGGDGSATLVDLGQGISGVFIRVRAQAQHDLQAGDALMVGEHLLRLEVV
jgi:ribosomal protein L40E